MSLINVLNLTFAYDGSYENIFENVSFQIDTDWKLGFVGRNGRGKTTFFNLLMGKYKYSGSISSSVDFEYFPFSIKDESLYTWEIVENIALGVESWQLIKELNLLKTDAEILYRPFNTLSNGEKTKVLLAALFLKENSFLLIDEPTNHLDIHGREVIGKYLNSKKGFILISHDRALLDSCTDHTLSINKNNIEIQKGSFSSWFENKKRQDAFEFSENAKLSKEIGRLERAAAERAGWSAKGEKAKFKSANSSDQMGIDRGFIGHKAEKMMKRAKAIEERQNKAVEEKSRLLKNIDYSPALSLHPLEFFTNRLLELSDISIKYGEKTVCEDFKLTVNQGDRIALQGKNGCGKSSILKLICGENISHNGTLQKSNRLIISYIPQDASFLKGNLSDYAKEHNIDESLFKTILRKLDFSRAQLEKDMSSFSVGQKKKVLIAQSLSTSSHLYIWDEPLNYIDILSRIQVEELILQYKPTLLFVEHDKSFCDAIATNAVNM